ncbi:MAG TPA: glycosyltransferase family 4 protein [Puia sp.]|nr:glycosyltransferase family 4 protein [Puia sp.]
MQKPIPDSILIVSTCNLDWGGSEELWAKTAPLLQVKGFQIIVYKSKINRSHPEFIRLASQGVILKDWYSTFSLFSRFCKKITRAFNTFYKRPDSEAINKDHTDQAFIKTIRKHRPRLVIVSQGINFDGLHHAFQCLSENIPYVVVSQKAVDFYWPSSKERSFMLRALQHARRCFFVSRHNLRLTEEQFGTRLVNSTVIFNPLKISGKIPYPAVSSGYRIACVARLFLLDKGQDILLRILSEQKWKERHLKISFIGTGDDYEGLRAMAKLLDISNVEFSGQSNNMVEIWETHHALILPSRSEGLSLALVEAMAAGRPVIVTSAGGSGELVDDGITGFVGQSNELSFGGAMERAWNNRDDWKAMGERASESIARIVPISPENDFATQINNIINER